MDELDFSHAEIEGHDGSCAMCQGPIATRYFDVNGARACEPCGVVLRDGAGTSGARFGRAVLFGVAAAAVSALVWYGIRAVSGYEIGLIAIGVGLLVGIAVRNGSGHRGGAAYQALAIGLTYAAIAVTYIPIVANEMMTADLAFEGELTGEPAFTEDATMSPIAAYAIAIPVAFMVPVLQLLDGGVMGLIILLIALYEAWKMNRRPDLAIQGPFVLAG